MVELMMFSAVCMAALRGKIFPFHVTPRYLTLANATQRWLRLRDRTRTTNIDGQAVPTQYDPYSLYMQLSRCRSLDGITLISKARERDFVGNKVPENMVGAEERLELLSEATIRERRMMGG